MTTYTHQTAPTQFVEANGIRFAYRRFGNRRGVPLVFNQHFRGTMDYWDPAVTDGLAGNREVILFNNAGVSSSSGQAPTSVQEMAAHAIAFIQALGLTKLDVLGFSIGGMVAQEIIVQARGLVRRLILVGTGPRGADMSSSRSAEIFAGVYDPPEHLCLAVHFSPPLQAGPTQSRRRGDAVAADLERADGPRKLTKLARDIVGDRLDILVANAGVSKSATIEDTTIEDFERLFAVNVRAPFFLVQQLLPILSKGSSIVLVASLAARGVVGTIPAYAATKGAVDTLVKHFASLLGARGIRVNAVAPGVVETDMSNFTKTDAGRDLALGMQALKRVAQPDDIGGVIAFLASEEALAARLAAIPAGESPASIGVQSML